MLPATVTVDLELLVLEGPEPGGQLTLTTDVENYLGFPEGIGGMGLIRNGTEQATRFGAEFTHGTVERALLEERPYELEFSTGETLRTRARIVASGASARWVGAENEDELMGYGLSTCATCDRVFYRGDDVLVIGGGDSAMEKALFLAKFADSVTVANRREELCASEVMATGPADAIEFRWNTELEVLHGPRDEGITGATLVSHPDSHPTAKTENGVEVERETVDVGGVFYAIGPRRTPNSSRELTSNATRQDISAPSRTMPVERRPKRRSRASSRWRRRRPPLSTGGHPPEIGSMAALDAETHRETLDHTVEETALEVSP